MKWTALLAVLLVVGCSSAQKKTTGDGTSTTPAGTSATPEGGVYGPLPKSTEPVYGPEPVTIKPIVLLLSPGMVRGYAFVGVLRVLAAEKIPIGGIMGTEMGGLMGALYADSSTINEFEWKLLKLKDEYFTDSGFKLAKIFGSGRKGEKLGLYLGDVFKKGDISSTKIKLRLGICREQISNYELLDKGEMAPAIRAGFAVSDVFEPYKLDDVLLYSAATTRPYDVEGARDLGIGPVVVVDVMSEDDPAGNGYAKAMNEAEQNSRKELDSADLVIRPDMRGIGFFDFNKKNTAVSRGKRAAVGNIQKIKELVGLK